MIATREEIKTILQVNNTTYDNYIDNMIPIIENAIIEYCNNYFIDQKFDWFSGQFTFTNSDNSITFSDYSDKKLVAGDNIRIFNSYRNDYVYTIESITDTKITVNSLYTVNDETETNTSYLCKINYPILLKNIVSKMTKFDVIDKIDLNLKSETISKYSYVYQDNIQGYPSSIIQPLQNFRKVFRDSIFNNNNEVCLLD